MRVGYRNYFALGIDAKIPDAARQQWNCSQSPPLKPTVLEERHKLLNYFIKAKTSSSFSQE
ncbi:hypothetical protein [Aquimarina brevivitae]|uniref:Uncharacterized protein n=1 Tax=Aquimarina brevivitae TaxID=323412 RepID=A0A4V2F4U7_9FLAO|nr:hypothetical protein [Aquimarina brevivitae]RZS90559.1 hypothetical protein EV197_3353 [Aquimarina brevivitae]